MAELFDRIRAAVAADRYVDEVAKLVTVHFFDE